MRWAGIDSNIKVTMDHSWRRPSFGSLNEHSYQTAIMKIETAILGFIAFSFKRTVRQTWHLCNNFYINTYQFHISISKLLRVFQVIFLPHEMGNPDHNFPIRYNNKPSRQTGYARYQNDITHRFHIPIDIYQVVWHTIYLYINVVWY